MTAAGWTLLTVVYLTGAVTLSVSDVRRGLLPNRTVAVWAVAVAVAAAVADRGGGPDGWAAPVVAAAMSGGLFFGLWRAGAVGGGDVKAAAVPAVVSAYVGGWVGLGQAAVAVGVACVLMCAAISVVWAFKRRLPPSVPFGPVLFTAALWPLWEASPFHT